MFKRSKLRISGPHPQHVSIHRLASGVPSIRAKHFNDVLWGSGYMHAHDRASQMLLMRILGQGRVCELLSDTEESLRLDQFFRKAHWASQLDEEVAKLHPHYLAACQAYAEGVNAGLASKRISALKLLGYSPEPWRIQDSILISRMASYLTLAQSQAEVERLFIELVQAGVASELLAELFPVEAENIDRELIESIRLQERIVPVGTLWNLALPRMMASNNWVIAGSKTASGSAILANDPHLEINRLPNVWAEQVLEWPENTAKGLSMPGLPGIIVGRSNQLAWGITYTFMDTIDSWVEDCKEGMYRVGENWIPFEQRIEEIKRQKHDDVSLCFYENKHGVLEGNPNEPGHYLASKWVADAMGAASLMAGLGICEAQTVAQGMRCLAQSESAWNWVFADVEGNIGYQMSGLMPLRHPGWNGFMPAPGWNSQYDWQGRVPLEDLPACFNPACGYIVTANQDLNYLGRSKPINMPMGDYRAQRITNLIEARNTHTCEDSQRIQMDVYSLQAEAFLAVLLPLLAERKEASPAYQVLAAWNKEYDPDSIGAPLFECFYRALRERVFGASRAGLGEPVVKHLAEQTGVFIDFYQNFDGVLLNPESVWYKHPGNCQPTQKEAFLEAFECIRGNEHFPRWKEVNTVVFTNLLFQGKLPAFLGFDTPPVAIAGGRATPHQGQIYKSAGRQTSFAPSARVVSDMQTNTLYTSCAGGPSDNRFSPWYLSEQADWLKGVFKPL